MPVYVNPQTGERFENVPEEEAARAESEFGLVPLETFEAEQRSGGIGGQLAAAGEEAIRQAAVLVPGVDAGAAPAGLTELEPGQEENALTGVYSPEARERRAVNPTAAGIGGSAPLAVAGLALPGAGAAGVAASLGLDVLGGYTQEAVDAELENRDIRGEDVLRNAGLNVAFSLGMMGLGAGARAAARGGKGLLEMGAEAARRVSRGRAAAAEGAELAEVVADTATRDELLTTLSARSEEAVLEAEKRLSSVSAPKVANNPNAQRQAVEQVVDAFEASDPAVAGELREFMKGPARQRLQGLRDMRAGLPDDSEVAQALDSVLSRADLWGDEAISAGGSLEAALKLRPPPGASPEQLLEFASAVRKAQGGEFAGLADQIEQLAERGAEVRAAATLGGETGEKAAGRVDYRAAMKEIDPNEAWRLTKDGADEGLRKVEAATVSDALQRVNDTLKEDVAMSVKRQDFVQGAEKWTERQVAKQEEWLGAAAQAPEPAAAKPAILDNVEMLDGEGMFERVGAGDARLSQVEPEIAELRRTGIGDASLEDLRALPFEGDELKPGGDKDRYIQGIADDETFRTTGNVKDNMGSGRSGLPRLDLSDGQFHLSNGRHRLEAARRAGLDEIVMQVRKLDANGNPLWDYVGPVRVKAPDAAPVGKAASGVIGEASGLLDLMRKSRGASPESGYNLEGFAASTERLLDTSLRRIADADPVTRNFEVDQLKRGLDGIAKRLSESIKIDQATKAFGTERILALSNKLRQGLENAELFGRNSVLQSETNAAWKKLIDPYSRVQKRMSEFLGREFGNVGENSGRIIRFDPDMVERAMGVYDRNFRADLEAAVAGLDQMMKARQANGLSRLDRLASARADLERIREGFEFADLLRVAKAKAKEPVAAAIARKLGGGVGGGAVGTVAERLTGDVFERVGMLKPGSKSGLNAALRKHLGLARNEQSKLLGEAAFSETLSPELKRRLLATGEAPIAQQAEPGSASAQATPTPKMGNRPDEPTRGAGTPAQSLPPEIQRQMRAVTDGAASPVVELADQSAKAAERDRKLTARLMVDPDAAGRHLRLVGDVAAPVARFQGEHESPEQAFKEAQRMLADFERNPEAMLSLLDEEFGDVGAKSPKLQREMVVQATRVVSYLQKHMPGQRNKSVVYPNGTPPSQMEVRNFALRFTAATDPASVLGDARAGRLQKVQVDTLKELWPREYDALRVGVLEQLGTGKASTNMRQRMSILFEFGSEVDPALGPRTRAVVAAARAAQEQQQPAAPSGGGAALTSKPPSVKASTPGGIASMQLGQQISF